MRFAEPFFLWVLLVALPAAGALFYWSWRVKQKLIRQFIRSRLLASLTAGLSPRRQAARLGLLIAALAGVLLALARPQWGFAWEEAKQRGLDIIVAIDTSRSMLATDIAPNRLDRAKLAAYDLMRLAKNDRLGLIAFAGTAFLQSPLTLDDQAFRQNVDALTTHIIPTGGTSLSSAILTALQAFEKNNDNHKVLVLFTDGEDHDDDTETLGAAKEAAAAGMHIFTVGVGTKEGDLLRVMDNDGNYSYIKDDDGNVVKSRLNEKLLEQIATMTQGFYLPLRGPNPMEILYKSGLAPLPKTESNTRLTKVYRERYHWFLAFAVGCLLLEFTLPEGARRSRRSDGIPSQTRTALQQAAATVCLVLAAMSLHASPSSAFHDYQTGDFTNALDEYSRLATQQTNDYRLNYDAGEAAYRAKQLDKAEKQFNATLNAPNVVPDVPTQEHTYYDLGNTQYRQGESLQDMDKKKERWEQAIDNYTRALQLSERLKTNDPDAQNNLSYVKYKLEELKKQQQQQQKQQQKNQKNQQQQQNQKQQKNQGKNGQEQQQQQQGQQKNEQQKQQEEQQRQRAEAQKQKEQQEQQAQTGEQKDKSQQEAQKEAAARQMTPEEARQILAEEKDDERTLIFAPSNAPPPNPEKKIKDW